jgi:hypothetical protein
MRCGLSVFQWSGSSWFHCAIARRAVKVTAVLTLDNLKTFGNAICMRAPSVHLRKSDCAYLSATRTPKIFNPTVISVHPKNIRLGPPVFQPGLCHNQTNPLPAGSYPPRNVASDRSLVYIVWKLTSFGFGSSNKDSLDTVVKAQSPRYPDAISRRSVLLSLSRRARLTPSHSANEIAAQW